MNILILLIAILVFAYAIARQLAPLRNLVIAAAVFLAAFTLLGGFSFFWGLVFWLLLLVPLLSMPPEFTWFASYAGQCVDRNGHAWRTRWTDFRKFLALSKREFIFGANARICNPCDDLRHHTVVFPRFAQLGSLQKRHQGLRFLPPLGL